MAPAAWTALTGSLATDRNAATLSVTSTATRVQVTHGPRADRRSPCAVRPSGDTTAWSVVSRTRSCTRRCAARCHWGHLAQDRLQSCWRSAIASSRRLRSSSGRARNSSGGIGRPSLTGVSIIPTGVRASARPRACAFFVQVAERLFLRLLSLGFDLVLVGAELLALERRLDRHAQFADQRLHGVAKGGASAGRQRQGARPGRILEIVHVAAVRRHASRRSLAPQ